MKLKNNALQELYDTLVGGNPTISPYAESPFDKAFRECDEKLQKDIDIWQRSNDILLSANLKAIGKKRKLEKDLDDAVKENEKLKASLSYSALQKMQKDLDDVKNQLNCCTHSRDDWRSRAKYAEDEVKELKETLEKVNADRTELQKDRDFYYGLYTELKKDYDKLFEDNRKLKARTDCLRYEVEWYRKHYKEQSDKIEELKSTLNSMCGSVRDIGYKQGQTDLWKMLTEVGDATTSELCGCFPDVCEVEDLLAWDLDDFVEEYRKWAAKKEDRKTCAVADSVKRRNVYRQLGVGEGARKLWDMLQNVNNSQPFEIATCFPDVTGMEDILNWDLEGFLDAYKKWQEEKEKERLDHMRDYLARFCEGRLCAKCPLGSDEYNCGKGYSFRRRDQFDTRVIPDEELEKYYEKARGGGQCTLKDGKLCIHDISHPMAGVNEAIKNACERFTKAVEAANINISTSAWHGDATSEKIKIEPWSCTLEGTINVEFDRDLLEKVCGVKPEEENHKLEYGDAVRVSWSNFDYMYIGPDEHRIRLFDPKYRCVIFVSSTEKLTYQGSKIIICDEEDLRKIWKDKK